MPTTYQPGDRVTVRTLGPPSKGRTRGATVSGHVVYCHTYTIYGVRLDSGAVFVCCPVTPMPGLLAEAPAREEKPQ